MSEQKITLELGGKYGFKLVKSDDEERQRFAVSFSGNGYQSYGVDVASEATGAEAESELRRLRDEVDEACEALVQLGTLQADGSHEGSL